MTKLRTCRVGKLASQKLQQKASEGAPRRRRCPWCSPAAADTELEFLVLLWWKAARGANQKATFLTSVLHAPSPSPKPNNSMLRNEEKGANGPPTCISGGHPALRSQDSASAGMGESQNTKRTTLVSRNSTFCSHW
jgi:hypothetical protein